MGLATHRDRDAGSFRPGQANLVIEGEARTQRVIARLIVEKKGLDVQAPGADPVEAVEPAPGPTLSNGVDS